MFVINWEKHPVVLGLGLSLPAGTYTVHARDRARWHRVSIGKKAALSHTDLRSFRVRMPAETPYVFHVSPAQ